jgi:hypothetical protein
MRGQTTASGRRKRASTHAWLRVISSNKRHYQPRLAPPGPRIDSPFGPSKETGTGSTPIIKGRLAFSARRAKLTA